MSQIIAVCNHKGGVAKTTTAVNLAAGIAHKGFDVLLIDLDPQANATYGLGTDVDDEQSYTVAGVFGPERWPLGDVIVGTLEPHLMLAPSDIRLVEAEMLLQTRPFRESVLQKELMVDHGFRYVVIDCPPSLHTLTINALVCANNILIPTELTGHALKGLGNLIDTMKAVKNGSPYDWRILLTKVSGHGEERQATAVRILSPFADRIMSTRIRKTEAIERSQIETDDEEIPTPVVLSKQWNVGARDYRALVKEVLDLWPV